MCYLNSMLLVSVNVVYVCDSSEVLLVPELSKTAGAEGVTVTVTVSVLLRFIFLNSST